MTLEPGHQRATSASARATMSPNRDLVRRGCLPLGSDIPQRPRSFIKRSVIALDAIVPSKGMHHDWQPSRGESHPDRVVGDHLISVCSAATVRSMLDFVLIERRADHLVCAARRLRLGVRGRRREPLEDPHLPRSTEARAPGRGRRGDPLTGNRRPQPGEARGRVRRQRQGLLHRGASRGRRAARRCPTQ
jgi:hypothetical protein